MCACGPSAANQDDGGPGDAGPPGLRVEPADAVVLVSGGVAGTLTYRAILSEGGVDIDVTSEATFSALNPSLGTFQGALFTSNTTLGGRTDVRADARGQSATTGLTVRLEQIVIGPGAPNDAPDRFGGVVDGARSPELVYPESGVLVPPNLNELEFHFLPGAGNNLFELAFDGGALALRIYFTCQAVGAGCVFTPDPSTWTIMAEAERGGMPLSYTLRGVDGNSPGSVGVSTTKTIAFAEEDLVGGLYYWNAGGGGIRRYDFGRRGQTAENFMDPARAGAFICVGCHALSRQGDRIAFGTDTPGPITTDKAFDVATRTQLYSNIGANFFSYSPDSGQIMTTSGLNIVSRDAATGVAILSPAITNATMPDWSPNGIETVFVRPSNFGGIDASNAGLFVSEYDGVMWGAARDLVPFTGQNNYYPTISPDGQWVLFNRSPSNLSSFDALDAEMWVVPTAGGTPLRLDAASSTAGDSWPKWAQIVQLYQGRGLMWLTVSSRRAYGLRLAEGAQAQLWMVAFDPGRAEILTDPSYPAFWLPFQEIGSGNHIAQWTLEVDRQPCTGDGECGPGEFCEGGVCVPVVQ